MAAFNNYQYDEFRQIGTDYESADEVAQYDERMSKLRNIHEECASILQLLGLKPNSRVLEIGTGTGEFAIAAAQQCAQVYATDVSQSMLDYAQRKAKSRGAGNIIYKCAGFLTYDHDNEPFDAVVSQLALHHLPDFWKAVALRRVWHLLKDGGYLYLRDVVFSFGVDDAEPSLNRWIDGAAKLGGDELREDIESHIRQEYSTFDWVIEGLLRTSGFSILSVTYHDSRVFAEYLCRKS